MSHFTRVRTAIKDRDRLTACLKEMGHDVREDVHIRGYEGKEKVDIAIRMKEGYDIGFVRGTDDAYSIVADWWGVKGTSRETFSAALTARLEEIENRIRREYALKAVLEKTRAQGYSVVEQHAQEDGSIRLVVRRWT